MASAILTATYPRRYGVIDFRVWRALSDLKLVQRKRKGGGFGFRDWTDYLRIIRSCAERLGVSPRSIDRSLWEYDKRKHATHRTEKDDC